MKSLIICFALTLGILGWVIYDNLNNPKLLPVMFVMGVFLTLMVVIPFTDNPISRWFDKDTKRQSSKVDSQ